MFAGHQKPSLKFLNRYVKGSVGWKWYDLGIELLHSNDVGELNTIEAEYPSDLNRCCTKMFQLWLKKQPIASWNQLIEALRQPGIQLEALASKIEQMLLQPKSQGYLFILAMRSLLHTYIFCWHSPMYIPINVTLSHLRSKGSVLLQI